MVDILQRVNQQSNRHYGHLPIAILDRFEVTKQNYCFNDIEVDISDSRSEHFGEYYHLYWRLCESSILKCLCDVNHQYWNVDVNHQYWNVYANHQYWNVYVMWCEPSILKCLCEIINTEMFMSTINTEMFLWTNYYVNHQYWNVYVNHQYWNVYVNHQYWNVSVNHQYWNVYVYVKSSSLHEKVTNSKHFSTEHKSTELLGKALRSLEMNSVHFLNCWSTRIAGFFDAWKQSCDIIIPFVDSLIAGGIRKDDSAFLFCPKRPSYTFVCRYSSTFC